VAGKIRVLIVDDSFLMRKILSDIVNSDPELEVIEKAKDGKEALEKMLALQPDVTTLDVNLPVMDGLTVLEEVMKKQFLRVIMLSAYTRSGASATIKALELGAIDCIAKPSGEISLDLKKLREEIISKIKIAAKVEFNRYMSSPTQPAPGRVREHGYKVVVIAASTGGPKVVLDVMQNMPGDMGAAILIIQHMPEGFTMSFAERISWQSQVKTKEAEDGDELAPGKAFVAPAGFHMGLEKNGGKVVIRLNQEPLVNFVRPAADVTMVSAANIFGKDTIGVVLTGMGRDGADGAKRIKEKGGIVIIQNMETSVVWGMPKAVYDAGLADKVLPVEEVPAAILDYVGALPATKTE
jgi:two-component system chemotaxis response regulator CheB